MKNRAICFRKVGNRVTIDIAPCALKYICVLVIVLGKDDWIPIFLKAIIRW
jgi:hypothetical protein